MIIRKLDSNITKGTVTLFVDLKEIEVSTEDYVRIVLLCNEWETNYRVLNRKEVVKDHKLPVRVINKAWAMNFRGECNYTIIKNILKL